ncbi:MAG: hypothetical protein HBSIN02_06600 [Bacteroidia bacterium]|nr:MAG: hypothetical protein HBSIN02_06600 [Bacteroidia bacterium]
MKDLRKLSRNGLAIIVGTFFFLGGIGKLISPDVAATFLSDATDLSLALAVAIMYALATVELVIAVLIIFIPPYRALAH